MLKKSFYRAFNAIFGKVGRLASEDVIIQLLRTKCLPVLHYGLEACPVTKVKTKSLDYALHSCFRKIFSTKDQVAVHHCMAFFDFSFVSEAVKCKQHRFFQRYLMSTNSLCVLFSDKAILQLFKHIYVILYNLLWNVQCVRVCMCVCVHVDFLFCFLPEMVNKVEYKRSSATVKELRDTPRNNCDFVAR